MSRAGEIAAMFLLVAAGCRESAPERAPHAGMDVVVVLIDTLRPDHLGFYGYERETAPFLAELARDSAVFDRAYSTSSWTVPATASLFTGLYPNRHGVLGGFFVDGKRRENADPSPESLTLKMLPENVAGLPALFGKAGYRSYGIATNVNIGPALGFDGGFDRYTHLRQATIAEVGEALSDWAPEMLASPEPTLLYLHLNDVHGPYERRAPWYREQGDMLRNEISAYDSQISYLDAALRNIATQLDWNEDTLLVFVSDHGEEFREHGGLRHRGGLHQELNRVLLMIRAPNVEANRIGANVSLIDLLPTVLELAGLEAPADRDGSSLVPLLTEESPAAAEALGERVLFAHRLEKAKRFGRETWAAIHGRWKLIQGNDETELFDLDLDFFEQEDRLADHPERAEALRSELAIYQHLTEGEDNEATVVVPLDSDLIRYLEELGYVADEKPGAATSMGPPE